MKYPTKKQIEIMALAYEGKIISDFIGRNYKVDLSGTKADFEEGFKAAIKAIKKLNK